MKSYVYILSKGDQVVYVGITKNPKSRASAHKIKSRGLEMNIIEEHDDISHQQLLEREQFWINEMGNRGHVLFNKSGNFNDSIDLNKDCPKCGKPIFGSNFKYVDNIRCHIDCYKAKPRYCHVSINEDELQQIELLSIGKKTPRNKIIECLIGKGLDAVSRERNSIKIPEDVYLELENISDSCGISIDNVIIELLTRTLDKIGDRDFKFLMNPLNTQISK